MSVDRRDARRSGHLSAVRTQANVFDDLQGNWLLQVFILAIAGLLGGLGAKMDPFTPPVPGLRQAVPSSLPSFEIQCLRWLPRQGLLPSDAVDLPVQESANVTGNLRRNPHRAKEFSQPMAKLPSRIPNLEILPIVCLVFLWKP